MIENENINNDKCIAISGEIIKLLNGFTDEERYMILTKLLESFLQCKAEEGKYFVEIKEELGDDKHD